MSEKFQIEEELKSQIERMSSNLNMDIDFPLSLDIFKIRDLNNKCSELILDEKNEEGLKILKRIELFLESNIIDQKLNFDKKLLVIILHNISCCYQKLKDYDNCISYLESVIYHYDLSLEKKHNIKIEENYLIQHIKENKENYKLLGDLILELRYSAKFHLQMSAIFSEANLHIEALKQAKLASIICEDNLVKTNYLYYQIRDNHNKTGIFFNNNNNHINNLINNINNINMNEEENILLNDKIKLNYKIIKELYNIVLNSRNYNNDNIKIKNNSFSNKILALKNEICNNNESKKNKKNNFSSYLNYRISEINKFNSRNSLLNKIKYIFGGTIKEDDWIKLLNIDNILYLSPLNCEDLDLDSDSRFELLKDTILEKIVMLTVAYYCISKEMKILSKDKINKKTNGEYYLSQAVEFSSLFFPSSCPIIKYYISNYYKNYGQNLEIIPEGKTIDMKVNLIRNEIEQNKETLSFVKLNKINYLNKIPNNNINKTNISLNTNNTVFKNININNILIPRLNLPNTDIGNNKINNILINLENKTNNNIIFNYTETNNTNNNSKINSNNNRYKENNKLNNKKKIHKSYEKNKKCNIPKKTKKNTNNKPLSSNSVNINNSNSNKSNKTMKFINSFNSTKSKYSKSKSNSKSKTNIKNKNDNDIKNKYKNTMKINLNLNIKNNNFDLLPNKNFLNFANKSKINEKLAPKFKLNFAKLNKSEHESDDNEEIIINYNTNINSLSKLITKTNRTSKKTAGLNTSINDKSKKNKKTFSINLNNNFIYLNGREIKTERLKNQKVEIDKKVSNKEKIKNKDTNIRNINIANKNINKYLSPKNNYASQLIKRKEIRGNQTERVINRNINKIAIKSNKFNNKINDIRIKFNSPQAKNSNSKTYRYFKFDNNKFKIEKNVFSNISFTKNNKESNHINSLRYHYANYTQKQKSSKSYFNNSNNNSSYGNKDKMIKSMEIINQLLFNKNKKNDNIFSENSSFQKQPFKNKINLNKHHINNNLVSHFKNIKY